MSDWNERNHQALMNTYGRLPLVIERGEGAELIDEDGKRYLDFITGLAVNILGHSHPDIVQTLKDQGEKFLHISNLYVNKPAVELAERLIQETFPGRVFIRIQVRKRQKLWLSLFINGQKHRKRKTESLS